MVLLCVYVQQGYEFGRFGLCICVYVYMYVAKKLAVWGLTTWKSLVGAIYYLLIEFNRQKRSSLRQVIHSGKEIWRYSINRMGKGFPENYITISHTLSTCNASQLCNATVTAVQTYNITTGTQPVLTVLSVHSVCVLWNSSFLMKLRSVDLRVTTCMYQQTKH